MTVIDVGAGDGYETLAYAKIGATVHAFEPSLEAVTRLNANLSLNPQLARLIEVHPHAFPEGDVPEAGFAKVDVDGGERLVLESLTHVPVLLVETHSADIEGECLAYLGGRGYACRIIENAWWRPLWPEWRPIEHNRWLIAERPISTGIHFANPS